MNLNHDQQNDGEAMIEPMIRHYKNEWWVLLMDFLMSKEFNGKDMLFLLRGKVETKELKKMEKGREMIFS